MLVMKNSPYLDKPVRRYDEIEREEGRDKDGRTERKEQSRQREDTHDPPREW